MVWNHQRQGAFRLHPVWQVRANRPASYFPLFGLGSWGCQSRQRLILFLYSKPSLSYIFKVFLSVGSILSEHKHIQEFSILKKYECSLPPSPVFSLPFFSWRGHSNEHPYSLLHFLVSNLLLQPWQQVKLSLISVEPSVCGFPLLLPLPLPPLMLG